MNDPAVQARIDELLARFPEPGGADPGAFLSARYELGLAWLHFAPGFGGLGLTPDAAADLQGALEARLAAAGAPAPTGDYVALHQGAEAVHAAGTETQKERFLPAMFTGREHWCQLFSEPGAGSDLAALATAAMPDGDEWIVNGQKVWTTGAGEADWGLLLARTDPDVAKHRGLTLFACDMHAPGVDVRPLRQADGGTYFSEVFLTDVRVGDDLRLGDAGRGWGVSMAAMASERAGTAGLFRRPVGDLLTRWADRTDRSSPSARALRHDVVRAWIESRVDDAALGASLAKIAASERSQRLSGVTAAVLGMDAQIGIDYDAVAEGREGGDLDFAGMVATRFVVRARAMSIEGGTNEIQRNIVGERVLGLPSEPRADKDRPWREVPRS